MNKKLTTLLTAGVLLTVSAFGCGFKFGGQKNVTEAPKPQAVITQNYDTIKNKAWSFH
jgi:outer membrane lipopolysaccharide assembly protein LptE/RlpB